MSETETPTSVRNPPLQERSRALLERILSTAGQAFDELGVDGCSTEEIARRAGVSIGAIYRFFPNKAALVAGLAERYTAQHEAAAAQHFTEENLARPAEEIIAGFFSTFSSLVETQPGWQGLTRSGYLFAGGQAQPPHEDWTRLLERFISGQVPRVRPAARRRAAKTFHALSGWLLLHAVQSGEPMRPALREAETVMVGYINELRRRTP